MLADIVANDINNSSMGILKCAELINRGTDDKKFKMFSK